MALKRRTVLPITPASMPTPAHPDGLPPWQRLRPDGWTEVYDPATGQWLVGDQPDDDDTPDTAPAASTKSFSEGDHPRGQPGNAGQFGPGGAGGGGDKPAKPSKKPSADRRRQRARERRAEAKAKQAEALKEKLAQPPHLYSDDAARIAPVLDNLFPEGLDAKDAHKLVGAPSGSVVEGYTNSYSGGVNFNLSHPYVDQCSRSLTPDRQGNLVMSNSMFFLKPPHRGSGLGLQVFSEEVRTLSALGVDRIQTCAGRSKQMNGYYTWGVLGYDTELEEGFTKRLPKKMKADLTEPFTDRKGKVRPALTEEEADQAVAQAASSKTVQDLMATAAGREYWLRHGYQGGMTFDLKPGSRSLGVLNDYLKSKGKAPIEVDAKQIEDLRAKREEARQARTERQAKEATEAAARKQAEELNTARAYWRGQAGQAGLDPDEIDRVAAEREADMVRARTERPQEVWGISLDHPAELRYAAYRDAGQQLVAARHADRMTSPDLADVRTALEQEAAGKGLDAEKVRQVAAETPYAYADGVYALARAYRDAMMAVRAQSVRESEAAPLSKRMPFHSYKLSAHEYALDSPAGGLQWDDDEHSIVIAFAATSKDRVGDVMEVDGIQVENHRKYPVAFLDHAQKQMKPIGKCVGPDGSYGVWTQDGTAYAKIFLAWGVPGFHEPEQVYELYKLGVLRGGSIGFRPITVKTIPADPANGYFRPSQHIIECELLEVSVVGLPANQDAVRKALRDDTINGRPLTPLVRRTLACGLGVAYRDTMLRPSVKRHAVALRTGMDKKDMSAVDQAEGGAVVGDRDEAAPAPHGAQVLKALHEGMTGCKALIEQEQPLMEHQAVKSLCMKMLDKLDDHIKDIAETHNEHYPDQPELPGEGDKDEDEAASEPESEPEKSLSRADRKRVGALLATIDGQIQSTERKLRRWSRT